MKSYILVPGASLLVGALLFSCATEETGGGTGGSGTGSTKETCSGACNVDCFEPTQIGCSATNPAQIYENEQIAATDCATLCGGPVPACECYGSMCETSVHPCPNEGEVCAYAPDPFVFEPGTTAPVCVPIASACGGPDAILCPQGQFCELVGQLLEQGDYSTVADHCAYASGGGYGQCVDQPSDCSAEELAPVCGCDGVTYDNDCSRRAAGVVLHGVGSCS